MNTNAIIFSAFLATLAIIVESQKGRINWNELIPAIKRFHIELQRNAAVYAFICYGLFVIVYIKVTYY